MAVNDLGERNFIIEHDVIFNHEFLDKDKNEKAKQLLGKH